MLWTKLALKGWIKNSNNTTTSYIKDIFQWLTDLQMELERKDITNLEIEKEQVAQIKSFHSFLQEEE